MISVVMLAYEEEDVIRRSLQKATELADEIHVVDSYSDDATAEIAESHGATVHQREWQGYADAWQYGFDRAEGDWILQLGADEVLSDRLIRELRAIDDDGAAHDGYRINRVNYAFGEPVEHWRNWAPIFFERERGRMTDRAVHEHVTLDGEWGRIDAPLHHYTYDSVSEYLSKLDRYTRLEVEEIDGKPSMIRRYASPLKKTLSLLFRDRLVLDGTDGVFIAIMGGVYRYIALYRAWLAATGREDAAVATEDRK